MRSYEIEALEAGKAHAATREDADRTSPDLAARAARAGRTEALARTAVLRLQRAAGNAGVAAVLDGEQESPVKEVVGHGGGQPLDAPVKQRMEASFGADFSDVRVHAGASAAASAQAVDAHAYTVGNEIVLGEGHAPGSGSHERTLAHELTHVVQQRQGPVDGTPAPGGISVSDPSDRFERAAERTADAVIAGGRRPDAGSVASGAGSSVQRQEVPEEEEELQTLAVQRQEEEEEELQTLAVQRQEEDELQTLAVQRQEEDELQTLAVQRQEVPEEEELQTLAVQRARREEEAGHLLL